MMVIYCRHPTHGLPATREPYHQHILPHKQAAAEFLATYQQTSSADPAPYSIQPHTRPHTSSLPRLPVQSSCLGGPCGRGRAVRRRRVLRGCIRRRWKGMCEGGPKALGVSELEEMEAERRTGSVFLFGPDVSALAVDMLR